MKLIIEPYFPPEEREIRASRERRMELQEINPRRYVPRSFERYRRISRKQMKLVPMVLHVNAFFDSSMHVKLYDKEGQLINCTKSPMQTN